MAEKKAVGRKKLRFKLVCRSDDVGKRSGSLWSRVKSVVRSPPNQSVPYTVTAFCGGGVTLPCYLSPETSAVTMEIRWFKETDCVYLYQNGQVTEGRGYEGRVSVNPDELRRGNVSLNLRDVQRSDGGEYWCEVTDGGQKVDTSVHLEVSDYQARRDRGLQRQSQKTALVRPDHSCRDGGEYDTNTANSV
ncbi:butyrophilin subfamily 1 member A1-like [Salminus brasiliensis]|uniref:butyrophilin subfamily 1 member A1-like n=1 Tax=Salminus brasiliensis TaxID=930266 RepID=UPI003B8334C4